MIITDAPPSIEKSLLIRLPVVVIGAGPVGLAAAAQLIERGIEPLVLEQGEHAGAAILEWGHIRLFSPWRHVIDSAASKLLRAEGWKSQHPDAMPTGREFVKQYLEPLAATEALRDRIRYGVRVEGVSRLGMDRTRSVGRADAPFVIRIDGDEQEIQARAVIDASATFSQPNEVVASGLRPRHFEAVAPHLAHGLPDVLGRDQIRFAGRHTVVVGAGHSAANTLIALARLADRVSGTTVTWLIRNDIPIRVYGSADDALDGRASIGATTQQLVDSGKVRLVNQFLVDDVQPTDGEEVRIVGTRAGKATSIDADMVVVATGFRPELDSLREIRLGLDDVIEAPIRLAPLIDPNLHSCGTVSPHGVEELSHPEPGFWLAGMKSYGRAPTSCCSPATSRSGRSPMNWPAITTLPVSLNWFSPRPGCARPIRVRSPAATDMVQIRDLESDDWSAVEAIYRQGIEAGNATFESEPPTWEHFDAGKRRDLRLVALVDGVVVGWAAASSVSTRAVYDGVVEHSVYVDTEHQGHGVGRQLVDALIDRADAVGVWTIQSSIFPENEASLRLHDSSGFRVVGRRERIALATNGPFAGQWRDTILIERRRS